MNPHETHDLPRQASNLSRINQWLLWLGLAAAVAWLGVRHGAHMLEIAPFLIILACPLMHVFGHGGHGHGGHGSRAGHGPDGRSRRQPLETNVRADDAQRRDW